VTRFHRILCLFALLSVLSLPAFAVPASRTNENSLSGLLRSVAHWFTSLITLNGEQTDGRCGGDPWGCPAGGEQTDGRCGLDPWGCPSGE
jgi:hypothetical protein